ncbi:MAG: hypothetical protein IKS41_04420 [Alphaproteobacteria bacterium]|nr:hypothetical protein [Alphaproteobacteria bacterium]
MKKLWNSIRDRFAPKSQDAILFKACCDGNPHAAHVALKAGANPNALTYLGEYGYSPWEYETQYTGTVHATPLIIAATSAMESDAAGYYQIVKMLMDHPQTNLNCVVSGHRAEWRSEHHHNDGYPPDFEEDYNSSLYQVLSQFGQPLSTPPAIPSDLYPLSQQMAAFLQGSLLERKAKDHLAQKAQEQKVASL